jgi:hypothetical protein
MLFADDTSISARGPNPELIITLLVNAPDK